MSPLRAVSRSEGIGARRWDALILGSGLCSLVAACRLGMAGHRVLVVEEAAAHAAFPGLREPFLLVGTRQGIVDSCLRELMVPLIERRRIESRDIALQVVGPELRLDVGEPGLSAQELVAWDLAKPDAAKDLVRALAEAAEAERKAMLATPLVRIGRRLARGRPGAQGSHVRGLPAEAARPSDRIAPLLEAEVRALSNLAAATASPEARARLLGSLTAGAAGFRGGPPWLSGLLRHRAESVHVEFRTLTGDFEFVEVGGEPGVLGGTGQVWLGRAMVLGAPATALARALVPSSRPAFLDSSRTAARRLAVHFRCKTTALPQGMGSRVVLMRDPEQAPDVGTAMLSVHPRSDPAAGTVDLVIRGVLGAEASEDPAALAAAEARLEQRLRILLPFADKKLVRMKAARPRWDDDDWLEDPPPGQGWPAEIDIRVSARPPVYRLDRAGIGALGVEGDLLLGWRAGDAIAAEL